MIPVAMLIGLLAGFSSRRHGWWAVGIVAVAWPTMLVATDVDSGFVFFLGAAALAAVNTGVAVAVGIGSRRLITAIVGSV